MLQSIRDVSWMSDNTQATSGFIPESLIPLLSPRGTSKSGE